jgi:ATP-dependent protease ClpP protease subunit
VIRFFAPIEANSINALLTVIDQKLKKGVDKITLLISSPGGTVFHGLSAYNFLQNERYGLSSLSQDGMD